MAQEEVTENYTRTESHQGTSQAVRHLDTRCYTLGMPTARRRHMITESEHVAQALAAAAQRWPADRGNRSKLLLRLLEEGHRAVLDQRAHNVASQRDAVVRTSGVLTGVFGENYLAALREDWPA